MEDTMGDIVLNAIVLNFESLESMKVKILTIRTLKTTISIF